MIKIYSKTSDKYKDNTKVLDKVSSKFNIDKNEIEFAAYEKFLFSYLFVLAVTKNKTVYLISDENHHKPQEIPLSKISNIVVEKRTDLNMWFQDGSKINLTSVVGVQQSVIIMVRFMNDEIKRCRKL